MLQNSTNLLLTKFNLATRLEKFALKGLISNFLEKCECRAAQRNALCRSRQELSNAYLLATFGFDIAESGLPAGQPASRERALQSLADRRRSTGCAQASDRALLTEPSARFKNSGYQRQCAAVVRMRDSGYSTIR